MMVLCAPPEGAAMIRVLGVLLSVALLSACAATGGSGWGGGPGVRWSGPYGGPGVAWPGPRYGYGYPRGVYDDDDWGSRRFRPRRDVVCDRATRTCYRDGEIDASETRDFFGNRAGRRVDRIRDAAGTNKIFRPDDDIVCNRRERVCFKDGRPDRSETRDFFGRRAARRMGR
jgi:hypothetical protein